MGMSIITDLQIVFRSWRSDTLIISLHIRFHVTDYSASLDIAVKQEITENVRTAAMLFVMPFKNIPLTKVSCTSDVHYTKGALIPR